MVELNERLAEQGHEPVDVLRFRPNLVLEGLEAHEEDDLAVLSIDTVAGPIVIKLVKPCPRCPIPNIDPHTAISSPEVGQALAVEGELLQARQHARLEVGQRPAKAGPRQRQAAGRGARGAHAG